MCLVLRASANLQCVPAVRHGLEFVASARRAAHGVASRDRFGSSLASYDALVVSVPPALQRTAKRLRPRARVPTCRRLWAKPAGESIVVRCWQDFA